MTILRFSVSMLFSMLVFSTAVPVAFAAVHEAAATISPTTATVGDDLVYAYTVTNSASSTADIGSFTIALPTGFGAPSNIAVPSNWELANGTINGASYIDGYSSSTRLIGVKASGRSNKLDPGSSVVIGMTVAAIAAGSHEWTTGLADMAEIFKNLGFDGDTYELTSTQPTVIVAKAVPTLSVSNSPLAYSGAFQSVSATSSIPGAVSNYMYNASSTVPIHAGTYAITADFAPTDAANYESLAGASAGNFIISKASALVSITPYVTAYDGSIHSATGTATGIAGEDLSARLDLSGTAHTNAGAYADTWTFSGGDNYADQSGTLADEIRKVAAVIGVQSYSVSFDGAAHTSTGTAAGILSETLSGLDVSRTTHTVVGNYLADIWTFIDASGNYDNATGTVDNLISAVANGTRARRDGGTHSSPITRTDNSSTAVPVTPAVAGVSTVAPAAASPSAEGKVLGAVTYIFRSDLRYRTHSAAVAELQKLLVAKGYPIPDAVTTYFGPQTRAAVRAFQKDNGLPVTGLAGSLTRALLNAAT